MENLKGAFNILEDGAKITVGYDKAYSFLILDDHMKFKHNEKWVKDRHRTPEPKWSYFSGVALRGSPCIELTYADIQEFLVYSCDAHKKCLLAPSPEKHYVVCCPEFGIENTSKL